MIVEYNQDGRIFHVISDPVPDTIAAMLNDRGRTFLDLPPEPLPEVQMRDPDTGHLVFDDDGEPAMGSPGLRFAACDISKDYVVDGRVVRRPSCGCTASVEGRVVSLAGLPEGSTLSIFLDPTDVQSAVQAEATGDPFLFEVDEPGQVRIHVTPPWPMLDEVIDVEVE